MPVMATPAIKSATAHAFDWLCHVAWPFWLKHGIDRGRNTRVRGFHEHLDPATLECSADFRRLRVVTRQINVFSEAMAHDIPGAGDAVAFGLDYLRTRASMPGGGYAWRFDLNGQVIDPTRDLYDHGFVLLALARAMHVMPDASLRTEALALDLYLQQCLAHDAGGYLESLPPSLPRRQNPHMHLFEAYLAAAEAFGTSPFLERADALVELFLRRLWQADAGALAEYFHEDLTPVREAGRFIVEPGHHAEWVWLLSWHRELRAHHGLPPLVGEELVSAGLVRFYERHGLSPLTRALVDELWSDGSLRSGEQRLWPQTERLKAEIVRKDPSEEKVLLCFDVLQSYIHAAPPGLWSERRSADGIFSTQAAPASSLYHMTAAIMFAHRTFMN